MSTLSSIWRASLLMLITTIGPVAAQPLPPDPNLQSAGQQLEAEAQSLQEMATDVVAGTQPGQALLRDLTALRTAIHDFRTGVDIQADPPVVGRRFARVRELYRDVRRDLDQLSPDRRTALERRVRRLERAYRETVRLMG
jgi:hypothetical protein